MGAAEKPQYPEPPRELADRVYALFWSARTLRNEDGMWRFPGGKKGAPVTESVRRTFTNFHERLSSWRTGNARASDGPDFQLNFTERLLGIFKGDKRIANVEAGHDDDYIAVYGHWTTDALAKLQETVAALTEYLSVLQTIQSHSMTANDRLRLMKSVIPRSHFERATLGSSDGQQLVTLNEFSISSGDFPQIARAYLRGAAPRFAVAQHAAVRRQREIDAICESLETGATAIQIYARIAEGLTTVLMQTVFALLSKTPSLSIYWYSHGLLPHDPPIFNANHIVVVDDGHDVEKMPPWISKYGGRDANGVLIVGCRELASRRLAKAGNLSWLRVPLQRVDAENADDYIVKIVEYNAAERPSLDLKGLFLTALGSRESGGLFPAMFAATRGELLENRYRHIVDSLAGTDPKLDALACLVFCCMAHLSTDGRVSLPTPTILETMADQIETEPAIVTQIKDQIRRLPDEWEGELLIRMQGTLELRHPSISHIFFHWIFGRAPLAGKIRGEVRRYKGHFYKCLATALIAVRGAGAMDQVFSLIDNAIHVLVYDSQKGLKSGDSITTGAAILAALDTIENELDLDGMNLAKLCIARARMFSYLRRQVTTAEAASVNTRRSLDCLAQAIEIAGHDFSILLEVGHTIEGLPQPASITLADGREVDWHFFFRGAAESAERSGKHRLADRAEEDYLRKLFGSARSGIGAQNRFSYSRFERIASLVKKVALSKNPNFDDDRLNLLSDLLRWATFEYRSEDGVRRLPIGSSSDELPDSIRSVYREIWHELHRLHQNGRLQRLMSSAAALQMLKRIRGRWLQDERSDPAVLAWPKPHRHTPAVADLLNNSDWPAFAAAYAMYFPWDEK